MHFNFSFFIRVFFVYATLCIASIWTFSVIRAGAVQEKFDERVDLELASQAELLLENSRSFLVSIDPNQIALQVDRLYKVTNNRFTVINPLGEVIADSHEDASQMANHLQRPEIQSALASGSGQISRYSRTIEQDLIYYALPVYSDTQLLGIVRSAFFIDVMDEAVSSEINEIINDAVLSAVVGLFLITLAALIQSSSVEKLALIALDISAGNFKGRVPEKNALGLKKLAEVINQLARNSASNISDITADRNRLSAIFAGMVEGVIDVDQEQKILHINEAAVKLLGVDSAESTGKPVWEEVRNNEITQALDEAMKTRSIVKTQIVLTYSKSINNEGSVVDIYAAS